MKWIKKWSYLLMLIGTGVVYLSCVDHWKVYAEPVALAKQIYAGIRDSGEVQEDMGGEDPGEVQEGMGGEDPGEVQEGMGGEDPGEVQEGMGGEDPGEVQEGMGGEDPGEVQEGMGGEDSGEVQEGMGGEDSGEVQEGMGGEDIDGHPTFTTVEDDYFADAVFIGDSRTVGMFEYGGLEEISTFYASTGLTVYKIFDSAIVTVPGQKKKITVEEALQENSFRKIYLMIGINEMGTGTVETFAAKYREVVEHLLELQPDAILYIQGIMKVTTERSNQGDYITNEGIEARNAAIAELADNERAFYLDVNPVICDETGGMAEAYTFDGVHLKAQYIALWKEYLKSHAIQ